MLDQGSTGAMHDALGSTRGAAGEHDVQRVIEWQWAKLRSTTTPCIEQLAPVQHAVGHAEIHIRNDHDVLHGR